MEVLIKSVLIFILLLNVPPLIVVAPSNMPRRQSYRLFGLFSLVLLLSLLFTLHVIVDLLQLLLDTFFLHHSVLAVLKGSICIPFQHLRLIFHLLLFLKPLLVVFLVDLATSNLTELRLLLVVLILRNSVFCGPLLDIHVHKVALLVLALPLQHFFCFFLSNSVF